MLRETGFVSIRFEVRGGFRQVAITNWGYELKFQSALRFAVVSDEEELNEEVEMPVAFQSALRFAVVSDPTP